MTKVIKGRHQDEVTVSIDARNWEAASQAMLHCHEFQPDGYTLLAAKIVRRGKKGGRRCQLQIVLRHTNRAHPPITQAEADDLFSTEASLASERKFGREVTPTRVDIG